MKFSTAIKKIVEVSLPGMDVALEYTPEAETGLGEDFFRTIAERTLEEASLACLAGKKVSVNAVSVSAEKIKELNRKYRGHDKITDILSFGEYADTEALAQEEGNEVFLGELFFCPEFIGHAAEEDGITVEHELYYIFSHGVLHLLGFDHSDEMFAIQDRVTEALVGKK